MTFKAIGLGGTVSGMALVAVPLPLMVLVRVLSLCRRNGFRSNFIDLPVAGLARGILHNAHFTRRVGAMAVAAQKSFFHV